MLYSIQQSAALALGRLANHTEELAEEVVSNQILPQLVCPSLVTAESMRLLLIHCTVQCTN